MAWIEQTKKASSKSGGPQYYLQDITEHSRQLLRNYGRRQVRLWTPYGVVDSGLEAVSSTVGRVGHDRIQSGGKVPSIADQIAHWYALRRADIERVEFEDLWDRESFVIRPSHVKFFNRIARKTIYPDSHPLTLVAGHKSPLLIDRVHEIATLDKPSCSWIDEQVNAIVTEHDRKALNVDERDLLRVSGALNRLGINLGMYRGGGIDCPDATFRFSNYPLYLCPIEIEERSNGFLARHHDLHRRQRLVLLCMKHDRPEVLQGYIDIIELREIARILKEVA